MKLKPKTISVIRNRKNQNGLTFIELFIVIIILGILIGISFPNLQKTFIRLQLNALAAEMQSFMHYLKERSLIQRKMVYFYIDNQEKKYGAQDKDSPSWSKDYTYPLDIDIELSKKEETENKEIIFYPDGKIDEAQVIISTRNKENIILSTEGIFGKIKIKLEE